MVQKLMSMYRQDCEAADQQFQHQRDRQLQDMQVTFHNGYGGISCWAKTTTTLEMITLR